MKNVFPVWENLLMPVGSSGIREVGCGVGERAVASLQPFCLQKSLSSASGHSTRLKGEGWSFFTFNRDAGRKNTILAAWEASLKLSKSCGIRERAVVSLPLSTSQRSLPSEQKGTVLKRTTSQFVNGFRSSNKWPVRQRGVCLCMRERALANVTAAGP